MNDNFIGVGLKFFIKNRLIIYRCNSLQGFKLEHENKRHYLRIQWCLDLHPAPAPLHTHINIPKPVSLSTGFLSFVFRDVLSSQCPAMPAFQSRRYSAFTTF